jgi:tRNA(Ser,Leu) C12 N-acetylase TAN1
MRDYNIVVTFHPTSKAKAEEEIAQRIKENGLVLEDMIESSVSGLTLVRVTGDGKEAMKKIRAFAIRFPELFQHTHHWTPIEEWVSSDPDTMVGAARVFGESIGDQDRWRMDLHKRQYEGGSNLDLVKMLTEPIQKGIVDLEQPELIMKVEIIGGFAGFSLVTEEEQLDINQVRSLIGLARIH